MERNKVYLGDCLDLMKQLEDRSIDMILCDLPYGTTACKWDTVIPFQPLWEQYKRVIKQGKAILLFGSEPFSSLLRCSNLKWFKYDWIWNKKLAGNGILAKRQPLKIHEVISVFHSNIYYPQKTKGAWRKKMGLKESEITGGNSFCNTTENDEYYPTSIQEFGIGNMRTGRLHPTQKPVELCEYLIKTYSNEGELVLDNCMGSGTTAIACLNTSRDFIGFELDEEYYNGILKRIKEAGLGGNRI